MSYILAIVTTYELNNVDDQKVCHL